MPADTQAQQDALDAARYRFLISCDHKLMYKDKTLTFAFALDSWPSKRVPSIGTLVDHGIASRQAQMEGGTHGD